MTLSQCHFHLVCKLTIQSHLVEVYINLECHWTYQRTNFHIWKLWCFFFKVTMSAKKCGKKYSTWDPQQISEQRCKLFSKQTKPESCHLLYQNGILGFLFLLFFSEKSYFSTILKDTKVYFSKNNILKDGQWWCMPLIPAFWSHRHSFLSSRPAWPIKWVPEQPGPLRDILSQILQSPKRFEHERMFKPQFLYKGTMIGPLVHFFKAESIVLHRPTSSKKNQDMVWCGLL